MQKTVLKLLFFISLILLATITFAENNYLIIDLTTNDFGYQDNAPSDLTTNPIYKTTKLVLRRVPAGTFTMGSPVNEPGRQNIGCGSQGSDSDEVEHQVDLKSCYTVWFFLVQQ